jgi:hypothetical protein
MNEWAVYIIASRNHYKNGSFHETYIKRSRRSCVNYGCQQQVHWPKISKSNCLSRKLIPLHIEQITRKSYLAWLRPPNTLTTLKCIFCETTLRPAGSPKQIYHSWVHVLMHECSRLQGSRMHDNMNLCQYTTACATCLILMLHQY